MGAMASQISLTIVYTTVYSGADHRIHQSSMSLAFVRGIHRWPVNSPHKGPVTRKMFLFDDVIMAYHRITTHEPSWCMTVLLLPKWGIKTSESNYISKILWKCSYSSMLQIPSFGLHMLIRITSGDLGILWKWFQTVKTSSQVSSEPQYHVTRNQLAITRPIWHILRFNDKDNTLIRLWSNAGDMEYVLWVIEEHGARSI